MKTIIAIAALSTAALLSPIFGNKSKNSAQPIDNQLIATGLMIPEITISAEPTLPEVVILAKKTKIPTGNIPEVTITAKMPNA